MLTLSACNRIFFHKDPVNMRMSFEGLSALVDNTFPVEVTSGSLFVFMNKRLNCMKVLYWDGDGLAIWYKRLEKGCFSRLQKNHYQLSRREFLMLLEGVTPKRVSRRYKLT